MANIDPAPSWANIRRLETTDRNMAGPGGILNDPTTSIAARLNLLRDNDTTLGNSVAAVNSRQDAADTAIANIQGQVLNAPGTLSDLENGVALDPAAGFPDVSSVENSLGPVDAINAPINSLAARTKQLHSSIEEFGSSIGANSVGYSLGLAGSQARPVADRLRDLRSVLDAIPVELHNAIRDFTSTVDVAPFINSAMEKWEGGFIYFPVGLYNIAQPIKIQRGFALIGTSPYDTVNRRSARIRLLPESNCPMIQTPLAAGTGSATHYIGLENLLLDGNAENQTVFSTAVQFYGVFIGSWIRNVFILNSYGTALELDQGADVELDQIWISGSVVGTSLYAFNTNPSYSGASRGGMVNINQVYVENTCVQKQSVGGAPRDNPANRGNAVRLHRLTTCNVHEMHLEACNRIVDLEACQALTFGKVSAAHVGIASTVDPAIIRIVDASIGSLVTGPLIVTTGNTNTNTMAVRKATGVASGLFPDAALAGTPPTTPGYSAWGSSTGSRVNAPSRFSARSEVIPRGGVVARSTLFYGEDTSTAAFASWRAEGLYATFSTTLNQAGGVERDTLRYYSPSVASGARWEIFDPIVLATRTAPNNIVAGSIFRYAPVAANDGPAYATGAGVRQLPTVRSGTTDPTVVPEHLWQIYVRTDTSPIKVWLAAGVSSVSDWKAFPAFGV